MLFLGACHLCISTSSWVLVIYWYLITIVALVMFGLKKFLQKIISRNKSKFKMYWLQALFINAFRRKLFIAPFFQLHGHYTQWDLKSDLLKSGNIWNPTIWNPDHLKSGCFFPDFKWFLTKWWLFFRISNGVASGYQITFEI